MDIIQVSLNELNETATLFDSYRQFYKQAADLSAAEAFIEQRLTSGDSVIFLARDDTGRAVGFVQLYPSFSSVAKALLGRCKHYARATQAQAIRLATAVSNSSAKALYESLDYQPMTSFEHYSKGA